MPIIAAAPPVSVPGNGGFDYVAVDSVNRRVYAAHGGARSLLIVDADKGTVLGQVKVGPLSGVAVNPANGHVFTGNGDGKSISEVDPASMSVVKTVNVDGPVDAIAYDPANGHIYADEGDGTRVWVVDAKSFKILAAVVLPGHKPEYLAVDPKTHELFQNIDHESEIVAIDPKTMQVTKTIATPEVTHNHPLQYDAVYDQIVVGGENNKFTVYDSSGKHLYTIDYPTRVDQCNLDSQRHLLACGGGGQITLLQLRANAAPSIVGQIAVSPGVHTLAIDQKTGDIWAVWSARDQNGAAFIQKFTYTP